MYSKTTQKINITVKPFYLEDQSEPLESHYVWAYKVIINNKGVETVQLKNRYWKITRLKWKCKGSKGLWSCRRTTYT